jgi:hypothetical protein
MFEHLYDDPADRPYGPGNPDYEHDAERERRDDEQQIDSNQGEEKC